MNSIVPHKNIQHSIYVIRGHKVMLDQDLAAIFGFTVGRLNEAVKSHARRFPPDFMYQLTSREWRYHKAHLAPSSSLWSGRRQAPNVFTQEGVAMLAGVLNGSRDVESNIEIMRAFVQSRRRVSRHQGAAKNTAVHEKSFRGLAANIMQIFRHNQPQLNGQTKNMFAVIAGQYPR